MTVLIAIGGNLKMDGSIMDQILQRSGGENARLVVFPTASNRLNGGEEYIEAWQKMRLGTSAVLLPVRERAQAFESQYIDAVQNATCIFFAGGDQIRITTVFAGTPLVEAVRNVYERGTVVVGTSAGAAMLGRVMITGGRSGSGARAGMAQFAEGLDFEKRILFDQHFHQRSRIGRFMFALAIHPHLIGVGIDEDTAAIISGDCLEVIGSQTVTILDGQGLRESNIDQISGTDWLSFSHLRIHQLTTGCRFDLQTRTAQIYRKPLLNE
jgi:cyanophycinase